MASDPLPGDVWGCGHSVATFTHGISLQSPDIKFYFSLTVGAAQQSGPPPHQAQLPRPNSGRVMTRGPQGVQDREETQHPSWACGKQRPRLGEALLVGVEENTPGDPGCGWGSTQTVGEHPWSSRQEGAVISEV